MAIAQLLLIVATCLTPASAQGFPANADFAQLTADGEPEGWALTNFHISPRPELRSVTADGRSACELTFSETHHAYCLSLHQPAPLLDTDGTYVVRFACQATGTGTGDMSAALSAGPGCGEPCVRGWYNPPRDGQWHEVEIRLPARLLNREGSVFELSINNAFAAGDVLRIADVRIAFEPEAPLSLSCTDPLSGVLFTDAPLQTVAGIVHVPRTSDGRTVRLTLADAAAPEVALEVRELVVLYPRSAWSFDLAARPLGHYLLTAELLDADGSVAARDHVTVWRLDPSEATTRVVNGRVVCGDKPVVLLGTYHVADWIVDATNRENRRIGAPPLTRAAMLDGVARQGFGTFLYTGAIPPEDFLRDCAERGLTLLPAVAGVGRDWGGAPLVEQVAPLADDPRILGWGGYDEPGAQTMPGAIEVYQELHSVSPRRLVVSSFNNPGPLLSLEGEATPADLILMDIYTIFKPNVDLSWVGQAVRQATSYARAHPGLAVGVAPQAFIFGGGPEPTPEQLRAQAYLGIVNGARAVFPYAYAEDYGATPFTAVPGQPEGMSLNPQRQRWWLPDSAMWEALPRLFDEVRALEPAILTDDELPLIAAEPTPVQFTARLSDGVGTLIAVNPQPTPNTARLRFPGPVGPLTPLFASPPAAPAGTDLDLSFAGYEVKVYTFAQ